MFWPITTTGNFFNNWLSIIFYFSIGFIYILKSMIIFSLFISSLILNLILYFNYRKIANFYNIFDVPGKKIFIKVIPHSWVDCLYY